jgi:hypothetical protein
MIRCGGAVWGRRYSGATPNSALRQLELGVNSRSASKGVAG